MLPYWLVFFPFAMGSLSRRFLIENRLGAMLAALLVSLTLFVGLRFQVGADWAGYLLIYKSTRFLSYEQLSRYSDAGFYTVIWLLHWADAEIWLLNLSCAAMFVVGLARFARDMPNPWLTVCIALPYLTFVVAMSGIRQAAAIGMFYFAIAAYREKRLIGAVVWLVVGASFHASAILMLGVAGLSFTRNKLQAGILVALTIFVGYYVLSSAFDTYAIRYGVKGVQSSGAIYRVAMNLIPAVAYLGLRNRFPVLGNHERKFWTNMSWLSVVSVPALAILSSSTAVDRFALYLFPLQTYVLGWLPVVLSPDERRSKAWTIIILGYCSAILLVFLGFGVNAKSSIPYRYYPVFGS